MLFEFVIYEYMTCNASDTSILLPYKVEVDLAKYHICQVKRRWMSQNATPATQRTGTCRQVPRVPHKKPRLPRRHLRTKRAAEVSPMPYVPRLPRKREVDMSKYHTCHVKRRWISQSAMPATQSAAIATQNEATCSQVLRLPREKPQRPRRYLRTKRVTRANPMPYIPCLPRKVEVDVSKYAACQACHACHANSRGQVV